MLHAATLAPADAAGALSTVSSVTVHGGYTAAGIGMRNLGYGTISITGVPAGATVQSATLLWDILADQADPGFAQGTFNGNPVTGTQWATGGSPCWPVSSNFSYQADVTSLVTGNGSYNLAGFATGESDGADPWNSGSVPPLLEGASLVVVYTLASLPQTTIQIAEGATETDSGNTASATLSGFTASAAPSATTTYIVADGQLGDSAATFNGTTLPGVTFPGADPQAVPNYSQGNLWDTTTADVSSLVSPGNTSAALSVTGNGDCLVWVGQVLAVSTSECGGSVTPSITLQGVDLNLTVSGTCFTPGENVDVLLNTEAGAILLGTAAADSGGSFSIDIGVPGSFEVPIQASADSVSLPGTDEIPLRYHYTYQLTVVGRTTADGDYAKIQFVSGSNDIVTASSGGTAGPNCQPLAPPGGTPFLLPGPLHASGRWIEDSQGSRVKLASVNWYGAEQADFVPGGLDCQSIDTIAAEIRSDGFNSVRLPWSNAMLEENPPQCSYPATLDEPCIDPAFLLANPQLIQSNADALGVYGTVVAALQNQGVMVVLDDHTTDAQWAPGNCNGIWWGGRIWDDLFGTHFACDSGGLPSSWLVRDQIWKNDLVRMALLFGSDSNVIGIDLRNEPNNDYSYGQHLTWTNTNFRNLVKMNPGQAAVDWGATAQWAGQAIVGSGVTYPPLNMVEGLDYSNDLTAVYSYPLTAIKSHLVYSPHDYSFDNFDSPCPFACFQPYGNLTASQLATALGNAWGYILTQHKPYTAPVWVGEFGTCNNSPACTSGTGDSNGRFFTNFTAYLNNADIDWSYWPVNGTQSNSGNGLKPDQTWFSTETYGILTPTYDGTSDQALLGGLQSIQPCVQSHAGCYVP